MAPPATGALCVSLLGTLLLAAAGCGRLGAPAAGPADAALLGLGCALLLPGYALVAGLAPLHGWLGAAQDAGPREIRVLLCAPLPGVALLLLLRMLRTSGAPLLAEALLGSGLLSVALAGLALWRRDGGTVRLATLLQGGVAATAFGLGGAGSVQAGLLGLATSGLVRVAAVLVEPAAVAHSLDRADEAEGRAAGDSGWLARLVLLALAGVPPLALFPAEFLLLTELLSRRPALGAGLAAGLGLAALGLLGRAGAEDAAGRGSRARRGAAWAMLAAATLLALAMPPGLSDGLTRAAEALAAPA